MGRVEQGGMGQGEQRVIRRVGKREVGGGETRTGGVVRVGKEG